jgi:hypothetical protein
MDGGELSAKMGGSPQDVIFKHILVFQVLHWILFNVLHIAFHEKDNLSPNL